MLKAGKTKRIWKQKENPGADKKNSISIFGEHSNDTGQRNTNKEVPTRSISQYSSDTSTSIDSKRLWNLQANPEYLAKPRHCVIELSLSEQKTITILTNIAYLC